MVRDEEFIAGVMSRRCLAWLVDAVLIGADFGRVWHRLLLFGLLTLGFGFGAMAIAAGGAVPVSFPQPAARPPAPRRVRRCSGLTVRRDEDLGPPTGLQALIFTVVFYLTLATSGLLLLVALFTVRHRTLHDLASDLVVVRRRAFEDWCRQTGAGQAFGP